MAYLYDDKVSLSTMKVYVTAVGNMHREKGLTNPTLDDTVQRAMTGFKRLQGERKDARAP